MRKPDWRAWLRSRDECQKWHDEALVRKVRSNAVAFMQKARSVLGMQ